MADRRVRRAGCEPTRERPWAQRLVLAAGLLALLAAHAIAQAWEPPALEPGERVYRARGVDAGPDEDKLAATLERLETANPERPVVVLLAREGDASLLARDTAAAWTRATSADARLPWRAGASLLVVATARPAAVAVEAPATLRDRLGLSAFTVEKLAAGSFAGPAARGELARGADAFVRELAGWLDDRSRESEQARLALLESEPARPQAPDAAVASASERLAKLEERAHALGVHGADLSALEPALAAARADLRRAVLALPKRPELAQPALGRLEARLGAASAAVDRLEAERAQLRERAARVEAVLRQARAEHASPDDLAAAEVALGDARRELDAQPARATRALEEAEATLDRARSAAAAVAPPGEPGPPAGSVLRRVLPATFALLVIALGAVLLALREARGTAHEALLLRREQVERDARELRDALETLREQRDQVARPPSVLVPLSYAVELALAPAPAPPAAATPGPSANGGAAPSSDAATTDSGAVRVPALASGRVRASEETFALPAAPALVGETAALLARANAALSEIGAAWDSAEGALGDAETRALRATFFGSAAFVEAREILDLAPTRVDLEPRVALARTLLDELEKVGEKAREAIARLRASLSAAEEALDAAVESGLAPAAFEDDLAQAHDLAREAVFGAPADPLRSVALASLVVEQSRKIGDAVARAEGVRAEIAHVGEAAARIREQAGDGTTPKEDDPRFLHERAVAALAEAQSTLDLGVPEESEKELARARDHLALAEEALGHREDAQALGTAPLEERRTEAREAREGLGRARSALEALGAELARESWEDVAPPFEAAERTLPELDAALEKAASLVAPGSGRVTATRVQLLRLDAHLTELRRVAAAVERRLAGLRDDKASLAQRADELERRAREVQSFAREDEVALRTETHARLDDARLALEKAASAARAPGERAHVPELLRDLDALEVELDEVRAQVARDVFLCRRALQARRAAQQACRGAEDSRRRGRDRLAARHRETRARDTLERMEPLLPRADTDWHLVLDAYACSIRASHSARELSGRREGTGSDLRHALREARRALRAADRFDAPFVRTDPEPAQVLLRRALESAEAGDEAQAVELAERCTAAADDARRAALARARQAEREAERALRESARAQRKARERLERKRLVAESQRRAVWIGLRFGPARKPLSFDESSVALRSVQV